MKALRAGAERAGRAGALARVSRWYEVALPGLLYLLEEDHPEHDIHAGEWETALVLLRAPELIDRSALEALPPNLETRDISERRAAGARTFPELGAPEAYSGDPPDRRAALRGTGRVRRGGRRVPAAPLNSCSARARATVTQADPL